MSLKIKGAVGCAMFATAAVAIGMTSTEVGAQQPSATTVKPAKPGKNTTTTTVPKKKPTPAPKVDPVTFFTNTYGKSKLNWSRCWEAHTAYVPVGSRSDPPYTADPGFSWQWAVWTPVPSARDPFPAWHVTWALCNEDPTAPTYPPTTV